MTPEQVTGIIFCGGRGRRLGGVEKPLIRIGDKPLVAYAVDRLRPQVGRIILSVGADAQGYEQLGCDLVPDATPDQGPLGGLVSALDSVTTDWVQTCPADAPWTAPNLVERLTMDAEAQGAAVAHDGQQRQNLTLLLRRDAADSLARFYHAGGRAIHRWLDAEDIEHTDLSEIADSFININTPGELAAFRDAVQGASS